MSMWAIAKGLGIASDLVAPAMNAFGMGDSGEDKYEKFLRSRGIKDADIQKQISQSAGIQADKADMAKTNVMGILQGQGLGNSIIGAQAGMKADVAKNQFIQNRMNQLYNAKQKQELQNQQDLADFQLGRAGARRQGGADLAGGILGGGSKFLFDWMGNK